MSPAFSQDATRLVATILPGVEPSRSRGSGEGRVVLMDSRTATSAGYGFSHRVGSSRCLTAGDGAARPRGNYRRGTARCRRKRPASPRSFTSAALARGCLGCAIGLHGVRVFDLLSLLTTATARD